MAIPYSRQIVSSFKIQKFKFVKYLIVLAHPDDEVLGCGASIYKRTKKGDTVDV